MKPNDNDNLKLLNRFHTLSNMTELPKRGNTVRQHNCSGRVSKKGVNFMTAKVTNFGLQTIRTKRIESVRSPLTENSRTGGRESICKNERLREGQHEFSFIVTVLFI